MCGLNYLTKRIKRNGRKYWQMTTLVASEWLGYGGVNFFLIFHLNLILCIFQHVSMYHFYTQKSQLWTPSGPWHLQNMACFFLMPRKGCGSVCRVVKARSAALTRHTQMFSSEVSNEAGIWGGAIPAKRSARDSLHSRPPLVLSGPEQTFPCHFHLTGLWPFRPL